MQEYFQQNNLVCVKIDKTKVEKVYLEEEEETITVQFLGLSICYPIQIKPKYLPKKNTQMNFFLTVNKNLLD